jgi:hypothetical protein
MIHLGFAKQADRPLMKDFAAGIDPIGMLTYRYGATDARHKIERARRRKALAVGTAGGLIGGGLIVPAATVGAIRGGQAALKGKGGIGSRIARGGAAALKGMGEPFRQIVDANRGNRALKRMIRTGKGLSGPEQRSVSRLVKGVNVSELEAAGKATGRSAAAVMKDVRSGRVTKRTAKALAPSVESTARSVNAAFGSSAAISGGTALVGYARGESDETAFQKRVSKKVKELKAK